MTDSGDLRARLIARAVDLLDGGADAVSLRAVAKAAGVSAMAPYRHFADKTALLAAVGDAGFVDLRARLVAADSAPGSDTDALLAQALAYLAFARERPALFRLMFSGYCGPNGPVGKPDDDSAYGVLMRRVARFRPHDAMAATLAAWGIVHGLATLTLDGRLPSDPAPTRAALALFVAGLGEGPAERPSV